MTVLQNAGTTWEYIVGAYEFDHPIGSEKSCKTTKSEGRSDDRAGTFRRAWLAVGRRVERIDRSLFRDQRARLDLHHRDPRWRHDLPHHGLYSVHQPSDPVARGHARGRRRDRHRTGCRDRHHHHGALRQLSLRAGAGHGAERLFHLRCRPRAGRILAGGADRCFRRRTDLPCPFARRRAYADHQRHSRVAQDRDHDRHRSVPGDHRPAEHAARGRPPCDPGQPRRRHAAFGLSGTHGRAPDRRAHGQAGEGRHSDRHSW